MVPPKQNAYLVANGAGQIPSFIFPDPPRDPTINDTQHSIYSRWVNTLTGGIWYLESFSIVSSVSQANWRAVAPIVVSTVAPTSADAAYPIGQTWVNTATSNYWALVNITGGVATWKTLSPTLSLFPITPFVVGLTGDSGYITIQSAITAANLAGGGVVYIQPGSYTENLTLIDGVDLYATPAVSQNQGASVTITGTHTPPASGHVGFNSICFISTTDVFSSAVAGSTHLVFLNCESAVQNGHFLNLLNWTGTLEFGDFNASTAGAPFAVNDGGINNTGGSPVFCFSTGLGSGTNVMTISGVAIFGTVSIGCPLTATTGATVFSNTSSYAGTLTLTGNSVLNSTQDTFSTAANVAILMSSSANSEINNAVVSSSNNPSIDGAGAGTLTLGAISFALNSNLAGSLTLGTAANFLPGTATPYGVLCGGTTDPGAMQSVASVGTTGHALLSNGAAVLPSFQAIPLASLSDNLQTTAMHTWNSNFLEVERVVITSAVGIITCSVDKEGGGDLTAVFSDGFYDWDTSPADTVVLTAGTDTVPLTNFIYFLQSTKTLTASTVGWPATESVKVATVICQSAASLALDGPYNQQNWTEHTTSINEDGHIAELNFWIRAQPATWESGVAQTYTINAGPTPDDVTIQTASGMVLQLHSHAFPAFTNPIDYYVTNDSVTPYTKVTNLGTLLADSTGATLVNRRFSFVLWGVVSQDAADCKVYINLPSGSYGTDTAAIQDADGFTNYAIPSDFKGSAFLISRWTLRQQAAGGGTWTSLDTTDLRGQLPTTTAGGTSTSPTEFSDLAFRVFANSDDTKLIAWDASPITTATTRTITMADYDIDLDAACISAPTDSGTATPAAGALTIAGTGAISTSGAASTVTVALAAQPSFSANILANLTNQTGNGAVVSHVQFGNEEYDTGGDYDNVGFTFTAPSDGIYKFEVEIFFAALTAAMTRGEISIFAGGVQYIVARTNVGASRDVGNQNYMIGHISVDMTATQTAYVETRITGAPGNTATISGKSGAIVFSKFSGNKIV